MVQTIIDNIYSVGVSDADRKLFDALIPLPNGTSYNSYLIVGKDKTVLIDSVDSKFSNQLIANLNELKIKKIDYIVANHAEQDHSGSIPILLEKYPFAKVLCSDKCKQLLIDLLDINSEKIIIVKDKETINLGSKTLEFIYTPWVHWPETMCTYLKEDKILFSCDLFGSHYSFEDIFFSDELIVKEALKRYYSEIMAPFRNLVKKNIDKIKEYEFELIAPSHGPLHDNPQKIIEMHEDWVSDNTQNLVVVAFISMHGSTKIIAEDITKRLIEKDIEVKLIDLETIDIGELAIALVDAKTLIIGSPCFHAGLHPDIAHTLYLINSLRPKAKNFGFFGSFAWGEKMFSEAQTILKNTKMEMIQPLIIKGIPKEINVGQIDKFIVDIITKHGLN